MTNEELFKNDDIDQLYEKNKRYIYSLIKKYSNLNPDDVISCGNIGFTKAINSYSLDKKTKFITYASMCINNEILMFIRKNKKHNSDISLNGKITDDGEGNEKSLEDMLADTYNFEEDIIHKNELQRMKIAILLLPNKLKQLMLLKLENKTQKEISKILNITQSYVSRLEKKAYKKLKILMKKHTGGEGLNYEDNVALILKAREGDKEAFNEVTNLNLRLVSTIAKKFLNKGYEYDDIFQIGSMGLVKAINNFDNKYDVKFSTYAVPMILGEIKRFLRDDGMIKVSRSVKVIAQKIHFMKQELLKKLSREPTIEELSKYSGISEEEIKNATESMHGIRYLYDTIHQDDGAPVLLIDKIDQKVNENNDMVDRIALKEALKELDIESEQVIILRYFKDKAQTEVAKILGTNQVQVSRIEKKACKKLKGLMEENGMSKKGEAFQLFEEGLDSSEVAKRIGTTIETVYNYKTKYNKSKSNKNIHKEENQDKEDIKVHKQEITSNELNNKEIAFKLFQQGLSNLKISQELGLTLKTVSTYRTNYNKAIGICEVREGSKKEEAFKLFYKGMKATEVSIKLEIAMSTADNYKREYDLMNNRNKIKIENNTIKNSDQGKNPGEAKIRNEVKEKAGEELKDPVQLSSINSKTELIREELGMVNKNMDEKINNCTKENRSPIIENENKERIFKKLQFLKPIYFEGAAGRKYKLNDNNCEMTAGNNNKIDIVKEDIDILIKELSELKEVM